MDGFKKFIMRGNVMDLAVAVIIGAAFKTIVDKFVEGVVNPALGMLVGQPNFDSAFIVGAVEGVEGSGLRFGLVLTALVNFLMTAAVIYFFMIKPMNAMKERTKKPEEPEADPEPTEDVVLLREIRDALKK